MHQFRSSVTTAASCFLFVFSMAITGWSAPGFNDPVGDTFGSPSISHDISRIDSQVSSESLTFSVGFYNVVRPPSAFSPESVVGFIDIDVDQDPSTGGPSNRDRFSPGGDSSLGIEYFVDLFSERFHPGTVDVVRANGMQTVGRATAMYHPQGFSIDLPLALLGHDSVVSYGLIVGDFRDMSDEALNDGAAFTIPEPGSVSLVAVALIFSAWLGARSRNHQSSTIRRNEHARQENDAV
jgi:hypothetical protein